MFVVIWQTNICGGSFITRLSRTYMSIYIIFDTQYLSLKAFILILFTVTIICKHETYRIYFTYYILVCLSLPTVAGKMRIHVRKKCGSDKEPARVILGNTRSDYTLWILQLARAIGFLVTKQPSLTPCPTGLHFQTI